jgi:tripartite-type tricarboxylate transporter receptor subunit TctC
MFFALINNAIGDLVATDNCCRLNEELIPVSRFTMTPLLLVVHPGVPARTLQEYLDYAKAHPDALSYASHGPGSVSQLAAELLKMQRGIKLLEVPYKGVNSELPDLAGGQLASAFPVPQVVLAAIRGGKLRALAVMAKERLDILPDVPSVAEAGLGTLEAIAWNGIFVPAGTPQSVVATLHREIVRAYKSPDIVEQVRSGGSYVAADTPEEFAAFIRAEKQKWGEVIRAAGIKAP